MNNWVGTYKGNPMYRVSKNDFVAMNRRERNVAYIVNNYVVFNDVIVGKFDNEAFKVVPCEEGANIYETLGVERPVVQPRYPKKARKAEPQVEVEAPVVEVEIPQERDTLVE